MYVVHQTIPCPKSTHRPKLGKYCWHYFKALLEWANDLGRWVDLGDRSVWATTDTCELQYVVKKNGGFFNRSEGKKFFFGLWVKGEKEMVFREVKGQFCFNEEKS